MDLNDLLIKHRAFRGWACRQPLEDAITLIALKLDDDSMLGILNDSAIAGCVGAEISHLFSLRCDRQGDRKNHNLGELTEQLLEQLQPILAGFIIIWKSLNGGQGLASISL